MEIQIMYRNNTPFGTKSGRDEIRAVQHIQAVGQQFGGQGQAFQPVMAGRPQVGAVEVGSGGGVGTAVLATVKYCILIFLIYLRQGGQQV